MLKRAIGAIAFTVLLAAPAVAAETDSQALETRAAQNTVAAPPAAAPHETFVESQHATDWRSSKLIGSTVYGPDNASIGEVNDVLIGNDGKVRGVVIGVGGFLGVGEKNIAIPLDALNIVRKPEASAIDKIKVSYSKDDLKAAPKFTYFEPEKSNTVGSGVVDKIKSLNPVDDAKK